MDANRFKRKSADSDQLRQCSSDLNTLSESLPRISKVLRLAGNETRLKILFLIYQEDAMCPSDLAEVMEMTVPAVSQQLKKLSQSGLISSQKNGQTIFYTFNENRGGILIPILNRLVAFSY